MEEAKVGKILLMLIIENVHHSLWVSVTKRILWVPQTLQNKTLGVYWGILGLLFSLTLLLATGMKMWIVFRCDNPCQFWRTRSVDVQPSPVSQTILLPTHQFSHVAFWWVKVWTSRQPGHYKTSDSTTKKKFYGQYLTNLLILLSQFWNFS